jgi:hypothetical protein
MWALADGKIEEGFVGGWLQFPNIFIAPLPKAV